MVSFLETSGVHQDMFSGKHMTILLSAWETKIHYCHPET